MDMGPRQIMRAIQLGLREEALGSSTIWLCISCETCSARCPAKIDIARVMESLRWLAAAEKSKPAVRDIEVFHRVFLGVTKHFGRVHELGLAATYNLLSKHPFANIDLVPRMWSRGKISVLPPIFKDASEVKKLFEKVKAVEEKK
jgi:heterodisulfide reductase subunit C2